VNFTDRHPRSAAVICSAMATLFIAIMLASPAAAQAANQEVVPVTDLLDAGASYDNTEITVEGELVGDYGFRRDGFMWTQLNDDSYARDALVDGGPRTGANVGIGVRMPTSLGDDLAPVGGYRLEGPLVQLTGVWRYHDPDRGGETYLDVESLVTIEGGRRLQEGPDWAVFALGVALIVISLLMWRRNRAHLAA
jgi:hypothetical protein